MKSSIRLLFQTGGPPRRAVPLGENPLTKWSEHLVWPKDGRLPCMVGLEGCLHAFNYTNAIRTSLFFHCARPPTFLAAASAADIHSLQQRPRDVGADPVSLFDKHSFAGDASPLVVLENFDDRCVKITDFTFPPDMAGRPWRLVVGHENSGVSKSFLRAADHVVYVPQFGTISSLNVVSSLGIALHYASSKWSQHSPGTEEHEDAAPRAVTTEINELQAYQGVFQKQLPQTPHEGAGRVDARPIHPNFYDKSTSEICQEHTRLRNLMFPATGGRSGMSVLYENQFDQRNFGGLVRNANAFACDHVLYWGRRKLNVVGAVGSNHYLRPTFLGADDREMIETADAVMSAASSDSRTNLVWAFMSCGHEKMFDQQAGSRAALDMYRTLLRDDERQLVLSHIGSPSSAAWQLVGADSKLLVVVPQEGRLPPLEVLRRCSIVMHLDHESMLEARLACDSSSSGPFLPAPSTSRRVGLPSQVASAICLHRLHNFRYPHL